MGPAQEAVKITSINRKSLRRAVKGPLLESSISRRVEEEVEVKDLTLVLRDPRASLNTNKKVVKEEDGAVKTTGHVVEAISHISPESPKVSSHCSEEQTFRTSSLISRIYNRWTAANFKTS